jgi:peptidoglycan/LPS O-acetylase OafA/YrhL
MTTALKSDRLHGLDAVRGGALILGIVFHATMSYLPGQQIWPVADAHRSVLLSGLFFTSHIFRMTTFFLIAGFFGRMVVEKRGVWGFVKDRGKRIALPLVLGWPILFGAFLAALVYAIWAQTGVAPKPPPHDPNAPPLAFPLMHLWFLYLLLMFYGGVLAARWSVRRLAAPSQARLMGGLDRLVRGIVANPAGLVLIAAPATLAFFVFRPWLEWFGPPSSDTSLIPVWPGFLAYFMAFGFGWLLHRQRGLLEVLAKRWRFNLAAAILLMTALIAWIGLTPVTHPWAMGPAKLGYAMTYELACWSATFAIIGLALRFFAGESPVRRYIADSSYWLYLVHLPILVVLQGAVSRLDWPAEAKILLILGVAFPVMLASYELMVRHTFVGTILNGRRVPRSPRKPRPVPQLEPAE